MKWVQCGVEIMKPLDCAQAETVGRKRRKGKRKEGERQLTDSKTVSCKGN